MKLILEKCSIICVQMRPKTFLGQVSLCKQLSIPPPAAVITIYNKVSATEYCSHFVALIKMVPQCYNSRNRLVYATGDFPKDSCMLHVALG